MRATWLILILMAALLAACGAPTATPRSIGPTATERPFPTFGPTRTRTPTRTPPATATRPPTETPVAAEPTDTPLPSATSPAASSQPIGGRQPAAAPGGQIDRSQAPAILQSALIKAGVKEPRVFWFTFAEGDREEALMIQYASPLRWQDGYHEMLRAAKQTLGRYYLQIDPPLYTAFVVATDLTGTSDTVQRLRRSSAEKLAHGEIGEEDFLNNYFEPAPVVIACAGDGQCTGQMATPFPVFRFPFPFFTPTPTAP